eukprot:scaffold1439_cov404-Prasinococcus_capsulatus_cf.AAC.70
MWPDLGTRLRAAQPPTRSSVGSSGVLFFAVTTELGLRPRGADRFVEGVRGALASPSSSLEGIAFGIPVSGLTGTRAVFSTDLALFGSESTWRRCCSGHGRALKASFMCQRPFISMDRL